MLDESLLPTNVHAYTDFKKVLPKWRSPTTLEQKYSQIGGTYAANVKVTIWGKPALRENMGDDDAQNLWTVFLAGPYKFVDRVEVTAFDSPFSSTADAPYFRNHGFSLLPIVCQANSNPGNFSIFYRVESRNKQAVVMEISRATGSGGTWESYILYWNDNDVPKHGDRKGESVFFSCNSDQFLTRFLQNNPDFRGGDPLDLIEEKSHDRSGR